MSAWQFDEALWARRDGAGWSEDDVTIIEDTILDFRGGFTIFEDEGGPIDAGHLMVQRFVAGAWADWAIYYANNVNPGYSVPPVIFPPQYVIWPIDFGNVIDAGESLRTRLKVTWTDGDHFSPEILVTAIEAGVPGGSVTANASGLSAVAGGGVLAATASAAALESVAGGVSLTASALAVDRASTAGAPTLGAIAAAPSHSIIVGAPGAAATAGAGVLTATAGSVERAADATAAARTATSEST